MKLFWKMCLHSYFPEMNEATFSFLKSLFESAKSNSTLKASLLMDKNIFFLHLLGIDTNGHAHRPMSE